MKLTVKLLDCSAFGFPNREEAEYYFDHNSRLGEGKDIPWKSTLQDIYEDHGHWGVNWTWEFIE